MLAAQNTAYGTPDVLQITEVSRPRVGPNDVLIEIRASAVTQGDRRLRAADFPGFSRLFGRLLFGVFGPRNPIGGTMFAGRVVEIGSKVTRFAIGDDVFGTSMHGAWAEQIALKEDTPIARMPSNVTYEEAASLPYGAATAITFLRDLAKVQPGERVLINGAAGGVGRAAVQVAKHLGAYVTGVCGDDAELVKQLGADEVIDYRSEDFTKRNARWDVVLDTTEGDHFRASRRVMTDSGRYLSVYASGRLLFEMAMTSLRKGPKAIAGVSMPTAEDLDGLRDLVERGAIRTVLAKSFPLLQIADAHAYLESARPHGDVAIDMSSSVLRAA